MSSHILLAERCWMPRTKGCSVLAPDEFVCLVWFRRRVGADWEWRLALGIGVIGRPFFCDAAGRQAEEVAESCDAEDDRERPLSARPDRDRDRQAGECGEGGDVKGQDPRSRASVPRITAPQARTRAANVVAMLLIRTGATGRSNRPIRGCGHCWPRSTAPSRSPAIAASGRRCHHRQGR